MKKPRIKIESVSIGLSPSIRFKFIDDVERKVFNEVLIRSADKRFLTSFQCCSNCTRHAVESVVEYRTFLVNKLVELEPVKHSKLKVAIAQVIERLKSFLSISEQYDVDVDHRYLSEQLDILRNEILGVLFKMCTDNKIAYPDGLFAMKS